MIVTLLMTLALGDALSEASTKLNAFDYAGAATDLELVRSRGSLTFDEHARLYEMLGIAYASLGQTREAEAAFVQLAVMAPTRAIRYTLSPKVTFVFERARERAAALGTPTLQLNWPLGVDVNAHLPVAIEVVGDPKHAMQRGVIIASRGDGPEESYPVELAPAGSYTTVDIPPPSARATAATIMHVRFVALDTSNNEVALVGSAAQPRQIPMTYTQPKHWYERPWVWVVGSAVLAGVVGGTAYALTHEAPARVPADVTVK